jgi:hypothetical protein
MSAGQTSWLLCIFRAEEIGEGVCRGEVYNLWLRHHHITPSVTGQMIPPHSERKMHLT